MSLPKVPLKNVWLTHDVYQALQAICDTTEGLRPSEWAADVLTDIIKKRVRDANVVVSQLTASGAMRKFAEEAEKQHEVRRDD